MLNDFKIKKKIAIERVLSRQSCSDLGQKLVVQYPPEFDGELHFNAKTIDNGRAIQFTFTRALALQGVDVDVPPASRAWKALVDTARDILAQEARIMQPEEVKSALTDKKSAALQEIQEKAGRCYLALKFNHKHLDDECLARTRAELLKIQEICQRLQTPDSVSTSPELRTDYQRRVAEAADKLIAAIEDL